MKIRIVLFVILCFGTLFADSGKWMDGIIISKWYLFYIILLTGGGIFLLTNCLKRKTEVTFDAVTITCSCFFLWLTGRNIFQPAATEILLFVTCCYIAFHLFRKSIRENSTSLFFIWIVIICVLQALYGLGQYTGWLPRASSFSMTGSFDNPAGLAACLCAGFPFTLYFIKSKIPAVKRFGLTASCILATTILLSGSRAGILAMSIVIALFGLTGRDTPTVPRRRNRIALIILTAILITGLYFLKKDSADGRLLIWQCTSELIRDNPLAGLGKGGFNARYMPCQAQYFERHPESRYSNLAGEVNHPFNEYLLLASEEGVIGITLFCIAVITLLCLHRRNQNPETRTAFLSLAAVGIFACFSYPLRYPFATVMIIWNVALITSNCHTVEIRGIKVVAGKFLLFAGIALLSVRCISDIVYGYRWKNIADRSVRGENRKMLPEYEKLYPHLKTTPLFLFNYGAELNIAGKYEESAEIWNQCQQAYNNYNVQMSAAINHMDARQYEKAEPHYLQASRMCPVRFAPLYQLSLIYRLTGREKDFLQIARKITGKPVKVNSPEITAMKKEMELILRLKQTKPDTASSTVHSVL